MAVPNALSALSPWKLKKRKIFGNAKPRSVMERGFSYFMMQQPWRGRLHSAPLTRGACTDVVDCGFRQVSLTVRKFFSFTVASRPAGARCAYSLVPAPAADRRKILNSLLWGRFLFATIFTDAKIRIEESPPMNGWPGVNNLFPKPKGLTRNSCLPNPWAATFLLTTIFTDAKIQIEEVPPMNG